MQALQQVSAELTVHLLPPPAAGDASQPTATQNQLARRERARSALEVLTERVPGCRVLESPLCANLFSAPATKAVKPTSLARLDLQLGPWLAVPVVLFKSTMPAKLPSLKTQMITEGMAAAAAAETGGEEDEVTRAQHKVRVQEGAAGEAVAPEDMMPGASHRHRVSARTRR